MVVCDNCGSHFTHFLLSHAAPNTVFQKLPLSLGGRVEGDLEKLKMMDSVQNIGHVYWKLNVAI
jgi:hypothetical protein